MSNEPSQDPLLTERMELQAQLRELLPRLHELDYLERHPLAISLRDSLPGSNEALGVRIRDFLIETIQRMKPAEDVERQSSQWRQYILLQERYVLRKPLRDIEERLALGERQLRREQQQAVASLAVFLSPFLGRADLPAKENNAFMSPWAAAVQRLSPQPRVFGVQQLLQDIAWAVDQTLRAMPHEERPQLTVTAPSSGLSIYTDRGILHQLLLKLTQFVIQQSNASCTLQLKGLPYEGRTTATVKMQLIAPADISFPDEDETIGLCQALAKLLQAPMNVQREAQALTITLQVPAGDRLRKVLIVDDEMPSAELFQSYLIGLQYETYVETNPEHALSRAQDWLPDVIVLDVMMPGMDGWELLQRLRHAPMLNDIPIIACSVINDFQMASALGASRFLHKPVLRRHLIDALKQVLAG
jgi:CheY-like chemotaxis protein